MLWGKRKPGPTAPRRDRGFRPVTQVLERRIEMAAIDLANIAGSTTGGPGPYGVLNAGGINGLGVGFSVADVGDLAGTGFDDYVLGAPTISAAPFDTQLPFLGSGNNAHAYLIFGSQQVGSGTFDFQNLTPSQRVGDLNSLGNITQNNPLTGQPGFAYSGLTFVTGQSNSSQLGASVAFAGVINGAPAFLIGAPGADGGAGRAYLVFGNQALLNRVSTNPQVDLDNPGANTDLSIITFINSNAGARSGRGVAGLGNFFGDGTNSIAIGAPGATINGQAGQGAVYVIDGASLLAQTATIDLSTVGQLGSAINGVVFAGADPGGSAGFSVGGAGNVDGGSTSVGTSITDLLVGAPAVGVTGGINGPGSAFLVYGSLLSGLQNQIVTTPTGFRYIGLNQVGNAAAVNPVAGARFNGDTTGDLTGWSVNTAGDFNSDGLSDFMIGSPGFNGDSGRVSLIYGSPVSGGTQINGIFDLGALPTTVPFAEFDGGPGAGAGYSVSPVGSLNTNTSPDALIGAPGFNAGSGAVYIIPGNTSLNGVQQLSNAEAPPLFGTIITISQPTGFSYLGAGVAGNIFPNGSGTWIDGSGRPSFIVGAPAFPLSSTAPRQFAGGGFALEGQFIPVQTPVVTTLTSTIGVDAPFSPPFQVNAKQPDNLLIYVFSNTASGNPNFVPLRDLDPTTVVVNGVRFPNATIAADPVDENKDGLQDAIITITPRSNLNLLASTTVFTLTARTLPSSPNANQTYKSSTSITVTNAGGGGGGLPSNRNALLDLNNRNAAVPPYGERLLPTPQTLSHLSWKPLRPRVAYRQFYPSYPFALRLREFYHPPNHTHPTGSKKENGSYRTSTLGRRVFTRSQFKVGVYTKPIHHKGPTIPVANSASFPTN